MKTFFLLFVPSIRIDKIYISSSLSASQPSVNHRKKGVINMSLLFGNDSDSDSEQEGKGSSKAISFGEIEEVHNVVLSDFALRIERLWLEKDINALQAELDEQNSVLTPLQKSCVEIAVAIMQGRHMLVVSEKFPAALAIPNLLDEIVSSNQINSTGSSSSNTSVSSADVLSKRVCAYISSGDTESVRECRALHVMLLGTVLFELYCQTNYTGPELSETALLPLNTLPSSSSSSTTSSASLIHRASIDGLESDGDVAYPICVIPQALFLARVFLSTVADPKRASWKHGIRLSESGEVLPQYVSAYTVDSKVVSATTRLQSRQWRSARAAVVHLRLLQKQSYDAMPTLWKECNDLFAVSLVQFGGCGNVHSDLKTPSIAELCQLTSSASLSSGNVSINERLLAAELWMEAGLCEHFFEYKSKVGIKLLSLFIVVMYFVVLLQGKECFKRAQTILGIVTQLTSAPGKRTKYQQFEVLQLYLYAKSSVLNNHPDGAKTSSCNDTNASKKEYKLVPKPQQETEEPAVVAAEHDVTTDSEAKEASSSSSSSSSWEHAEWELGRRLVGEVEGGEEASVREVLLDSQDGGAAENILLEGGPKFTEDQDRGGELHPLDQALLMALCLDVKNSNPTDGLTNEEMYPYVERVLQHAKNWMVHSTALLQRSWLEFERRKTMDRALLQMQALLDQHTTRLTITQSTFKSVEESAPAQDRLRYLFALAYPAQYELKRDLAKRYLSCQVFQSALAYFKELEMWDEVVTCYQLMDKPQRAELVVRDRLKFGETPYMLTALADLTQDAALYERAWQLSNRRYARAKRTLARMSYDVKDFAKCIEHMDEALAVHPLVPTAWYLKGLACMQSERYADGIHAFSRCVQQDMEIGEAWANMGAIYMRQGLMAQAHSALKEALKQKRESWQVLENLMTVCIALKKWREVVEYMTSLLDPKLRKKSGTKFYKQELCALVRATVKGAIDVSKMSVGGSFESLSINNATLESGAEFEKDSKPPSVVDPEADLAVKMPPLFDDDDGDDEGPEPEALVSLSEPTNNISSATSGVITETDMELAVKRQSALVSSVEKYLDQLSNAVDSDAEIWDIIAEFYFAFNSLRKVEECRAKQVYMLVC
jgi:tetratricopeptide (TPR) repeat protein